MNETQKQLKELLVEYDAVTDGVAMAMMGFIQDCRGLLPQTKTVHGVEIEMHMTIHPQCGSRYYYPSLAEMEGYESDVWREDAVDFRRFKGGFCYDTSEKAKAHSDIWRNP